MIYMKNTATHWHAQELYIDKNLEVNNITAPVLNHLATDKSIQPQTLKDAMAPIAVEEPQVIQVNEKSNEDPAEIFPKWLELCNNKQAERERSIPAEWRIPASRLTTEKKNLLDVPATCGILTEEEIKITSQFKAIELLEQIKSGKLSSETVTIAFCKRAAIAQQLVGTFLNLQLWLMKALNAYWQFFY